MYIDAPSSNVPVDPEIGSVMLRTWNSTDLTSIFVSNVASIQGFYPSSALCAWIQECSSVFGIYPSLLFEITLNYILSVYKMWQLRFSLLGNGSPLYEVYSD